MFSKGSKIPVPTRNKDHTGHHGNGDNMNKRKNRGGPPRSVFHIISSEFFTHLLLFFVVAFVLHRGNIIKIGGAGLQVPTYLCFFVAEKEVGIFEIRKLVCCLLLVIVIIYLVILEKIFVH